MLTRRAGGRAASGDTPPRPAFWPRAVDPFAQYPRLGAGAGLILVVLLVPLLRWAGGGGGTLGPSFPLFFLVPVLLASAMGGGRAGAPVACAAIAAWDWYFIPPLYTVTIASPRDLLALVVFLAVALLVGQLATAVRRRSEEALRRARGSEALYELSMTLIAGRDLADVLPMLTERLRATFDLEACAVLLPGEGGAGWRTAAQAGPVPRALRVEESKDVGAVVRWVAAEGRPSGLGQVGDEGRFQGRTFRRKRGNERARFLPLRVGSRAVGVLELVHAVGTKPDAERERLLATLANGAALALEQDRLAEEERAAAVARESDRLKSALLSSVSHDLRTPLAGIKAAASSLLQDDVEWDAEDRRAFLTDIDAEADRLTRLVSNLLDLSRIEAGAIKPAREWTDVDELISRVVRRLEPRLAEHPVHRDGAAALPAARLDAVQIEQVLTNLLENAAKYAPPGTPITVGAAVVGGAGGVPALQLWVADQGAGIAPAEQPRIFDKFYRVADPTRRVSGTGMGLAIVKGLVEAHGGHVAVESTPGQGSTFRVTLPLEDGAARRSERRTG